MRDKKHTSPLGPLEPDVMGIVWELGDVAVADVVERLRTRRDLHHNTVMTVMKRLSDKGLLEQYPRDGRTHGYRPRVTREQISRQYIEIVRERFFAGSVRDTIAALIPPEKLSAGRRAALRKLLSEFD